MRQKTKQTMGYHADEKKKPRKIFFTIKFYYQIPL